jgi:imidazole glycerol-phosphate synthase subunit HisF
MYKRRPRIIPCLLLRGSGLVKTTRFEKPVYLGDPRNVVKIFNDKEADELVLLDITATAEKRGPNFELLREIVNESFMPLGYGGGIRTAEEAEEIIAIGIEKVLINTVALDSPKVLEDSARRVGSQSVVAAIDVQSVGRGRRPEVYVHTQRRTVKLRPEEYARRMEEAGAGEILLQSVDRDGTMKGYDLDLVRSVVDAVRIPVVACGGAGCVRDLVLATRTAGASAAAAGSLFVFQGKLRGVLISFPGDRELREAFET